jgi:hypothetical protein
MISVMIHRCSKGVGGATIATVGPGRQGADDDPSIDAHQFR